MGKLIQMEKQYNIKVLTGLLTKEMKTDLMVTGYPYKIIVSPNGEVITRGSAYGLNVYEFVKSL